MAPRGRERPFLATGVPSCRGYFSPLPITRGAIQAGVQVLAGAAWAGAFWVIVAAGCPAGAVLEDD
jgi:hypothetical protein